MLAIVLAGGFGTRLRSTVPDVPKPMAPVAGRPFLERLLDYWIAQGITEILLAVGYMHEKVQAHFGEAYRGVPLTWSVERVPLGTGGALAQAWHLTRKDAPFLVLNGDTFFEASLDVLRRKRDESDAAGVMAVFEAPFDARYGTLAVQPDGRISGFGVQAPGERALMNGGAYVFAPSFFSTMPATPAFSLESDWLPRALASDQALYACSIQGRFIDIGVPADYARAAEVIGSG